MLLSAVIDVIKFDLIQFSFYLNFNYVIGEFSSRKIKKDFHDVFFGVANFRELTLIFMMIYLLFYSDKSNKILWLFLFDNFLGTLTINYKWQNISQKLLSLFVEKNHKNFFYLFSSFFSMIYIFFFWITDLRLNFQFSFVASCETNWKAMEGKIREANTSTKSKKISDSLSLTNTENSFSYLNEFWAFLFVHPNKQTAQTWTECNS